MPRRLAASLLAALAALPACVTEQVPADAPPAEPPAAPPATAPAPAAQPPSAAPRPAPAASPARPPAESPEEAARSLEFGRTLQSVDKRADTYVWLGSQPGEDARGKREIERSALEAVVAQHLERFLGACADVSEPTRRRVAAKALAFTKDPRATPLLVAAVADASDARIQTNAAFALARRRDPQTTIPPLLEAARSPDADLRVNALMALWHVLDARGETGTAVDAATRDQVLTALETALFDPEDPMVRGHAAAAMGALGDARGVDPLLNLLRDSHPAVRTHVALALGKLGDRRAIGPLVEAIDGSPKGTARGAVCLGVSLLLERQGIAVPADMPEDGRAWAGFVERALPAGSR